MLHHRYVSRRRLLTDDEIGCFQNGTIINNDAVYLLDRLLISQEVFWIDKLSFLTSILHCHCSCRCLVHSPSSIPPTSNDRRIEISVIFMHKKHNIKHEGEVSLTSETMKGNSTSGSIVIMAQSQFMHISPICSATRVWGFATALLNAGTKGLNRLVQPCKITIVPARFGDGILLVLLAARACWHQPFLYTVGRAFILVFFLLLFVRVLITDETITIHQESVVIEQLSFHLLTSFPLSPSNLIELFTGACITY